MDKKQTNERTELHKFSNLAMMVIHLPVKFRFDWTKRFRVRVRKRSFDGQTDGRRTHQSNRQVSYTQPAYHLLF